MSPAAVGSLILASSALFLIGRQVSPRREQWRWLLAACGFVALWVGSRANLPVEGLVALLATAFLTMAMAVSRVERRTATLAFLVCAFLVAGLSGEAGGSGWMTRFAQQFLHLDPSTSESVVTIFRKFIHVTGYGVSAWMAFLAVGRRSLPALAAAVLLACSDELSQSLSSNRTGSIVDVLIDTAGASIFVGAAVLWNRFSGTAIRPDETSNSGS